MKAPSPENIDAYIDGFPPPVQARLRGLRSLIRKEAPHATEAIKYRIPTFVLGANLVHFAGYRNHVGFYPTSSGIAAFRKELESAQYSHAKGSVQFPHDRPLPLGLIRKMVRFRMREVRTGARVGKKR